MVSRWFRVRPLCLLIYRTASSGSIGLLPYDLHGINREETCTAIWLQRGGPQNELCSINTAHLRCQEVLLFSLASMVVLPTS